MKYLYVPQNDETGRIIRPKYRCTKIICDIRKYYNPMCSSQKLSRDSRDLDGMIIFDV
jgi:hypothetical protein